MKLFFCSFEIGRVGEGAGLRCLETYIFSFNLLPVMMCGWLNGGGIGTMYGGKEGVSKADFHALFVDVIDTMGGYCVVDQPPWFGPVCMHILYICFLLYTMISCYILGGRKWGAIPNSLNKIQTSGVCLELNIKKPEYQMVGAT